MQRSAAYHMIGATPDDHYRAGVAAERARCAALVPTNWCDALLTGKDAPRPPLDGPAIERLLLGVKNRILNSEEQ